MLFIADMQLANKIVERYTLLNYLKETIFKWNSPNRETQLTRGSGQSTVKEIQSHRSVGPHLGQEMTNKPADSQC